MSERSWRFHPPMLGAVAGLALANLVLGLNPHLQTPLGIARLLLCGALLGLLPFLPAAFRRVTAPRPARATLLASAAFLAFLALLVERQRQLYYLWLMNGSRRVLVATSLALALGAAALLVAAARPPSRERLSRLLLAALLLVLTPPFLGRRAPERTPLATPEPLAGRRTRGLFVVGLEGISWDLVSAWASDGTLPVFARLLREGSAGPLVSPEPYVRSALWTSAATGKRPSRHGVVADRAFATPVGLLRLLPRARGAPESQGFPFGRTVPLAGRARRSRTFWEILAARGHGVAVVAWPASYPAGEGAVLWATEELFDGDASPDAGRPPEAARAARLLASSGAPLDRFLERTLVPAALSPGDRAAARPLEGAARDIAVVGATLSSLPPGPTSAAALVLSGIADEARLFTPAAAPDRFFGNRPKGREARALALRAYYRFLDETLGDLLEREGGERVFCVFAPVSWGPRATGTQALDFLAGREPHAAPDASRDGFVAFYGQGIRAGVRLTAASVVDLAPTLLVLAGEPIARDMDGRVLAEAFDDRFARDTSVPIVTTFEPEGPQ